MDALFEARFSPLADSGRILNKCGKCARYMKYISTQPSRLYFGTCEEVHNLRQKGTIKAARALVKLAAHGDNNSSNASFGQEAGALAD
ncbi:Dna topoisomerase 3-beta [Thalictrum thalictroides]|uniref:Dna topoisomerase 3-beta n=1 Tax=Thalictrum thalictroides TaxID=46969 RepID=A0A7J6VPD1_THATH|nr:Dna topoisomerase 3-beta [Thalictrum thalictroides]